MLSPNDLNCPSQSRELEAARNYLTCCIMGTLMSSKDTELVTPICGLYFLLTRRHDFLYIPACSQLWLRE